MAVVHDFEEDLTRAEQKAQEHWLHQILEKAFPNFLDTIEVPRDTPLQFVGVDHIVVFHDGSVAYVDHKFRDTHYPDILLEYLNMYDTGKQTPGWIEKQDTITDWLNYVIVPSRTAYLLPFKALQELWLEKKEEWLNYADERRNGFRRVEAKNGSYITVSLAVPTDVLLNQLLDAKKIRWYEPN